MTTRNILTPRKLIASVVAIAMAAVLLFGGTFAWQSISQEALNEIKGMVNPGGRLHDDFNNITFQPDEYGNMPTVKTYDKDVYVENFTSVLNDGVEVYARVRLDEYMEIGTGAGSRDAGKNEAVPLVANTVLDKTSTWITYIPGNTSVFRQYWTWTHDGGSTVYMPTFDKDNTSLEPDMNGSFVAGFADYKKYEPGDTETADALYSPVVEDGEQIRIEETHTARESLGSDVITMAQWLELPEEEKSGAFWVWDSDGWAYWAAPIEPSTATGLLLDKIQHTGKEIDGEWYYGINVVAQFITADDLGYDDATGFYDSTKGEPPSDDALRLLYLIGVDTGEVPEETEKEDEPTEVGNEAELDLALAEGGEIVLTDHILLSAPLVAEQSVVLDLGGYTIYNESPLRDSADGARNALLTICGETSMLEIKNGSIEALENDCYAIRVKDGATALIWDGEYIGNAAAVFVDSGTALILDGEFSIKETLSGDAPYGQMLNCRDAAYADGSASIIVYGGSFVNFDPSNANDGNLVAEGYSSTAEEDGENMIYRVAKAEEQPEEDETTEGETTEGETTEGETTEGETTEGETTEGETTEGETTAGETTEGETTEGETTEGETTEGETTEGETTEGETTEGETTEGETAEGETTEGETTEGETANGNTTENESTGGESTESVAEGENAAESVPTDGNEVSDSTAIAGGKAEV